MEYGERLESNGVESETSLGRDDRNWILGMFYFNPEDPAHIVEGRFGTNIGLNYARLPVKIGMVLFLACLVALYVWMTGLLL